MKTIQRRYDIDWIRVIAIGLLLIYHVAIGFQPWGIMIGFITSDKPWEALWLPMAMLNVWRIPLLFYVSGMGIYFAMQRRNWRQLLQERARRILLPFLFGALVFVPIHVYLWQYYYQFDRTYSPSPGHLWFLGNIMIYVVVLLPVCFYLKRHESGPFVAWLKKGLSHPLGLLPVFSVFVAEAMLLDPKPFELYAMTSHGFFLGLLAFFVGFCFVLAGRPFWEMLLKWRWLFLGIALLLFAVRLVYFASDAPNYLRSLESNCWIMAVFAFAHKHLNRPSRTLRYLSEAAYPVYIVHMVFLYLGALFLFPLDIAAPLQFVLLLVVTAAGSLVLYELVIRRVNFLRLLFGLRHRLLSSPTSPIPAVADET
ncbi:acyltransferase family protein [Parapedobacter koreensis]|uniref:Surface polysaccharide O-acyltransferase, integral membrane enzyme n=1 Tax=Parapedobacter koreensis TaxID=332977 RepID=A0A1H7R1S4_9SPHI|nr:acyltransferase family protein [Parapedobacter koreensis]SEL54049.1 Surface polysaccharide O-acyltransferase, integral membrane enzyme [Parapedobacter koreensis]